MESSRVAVGDQCRYGFEVRGHKGAVAWDFRRMGELQVCARTRTIWTPAGRRGSSRRATGRLGAFQPGAGIAMGYDDLKVIEAERFVRSIADGKPRRCDDRRRGRVGGADRGDRRRRTTSGAGSGRSEAADERRSASASSAPARWARRTSACCRVGHPVRRSCRSYDADVARAKEVCRGGRRAQPPTARERVIDADDVDAVLIAAPDPLHEELALACLAAGKPVLCEKPLATTVERLAADRRRRGRARAPAGPGGLHAPLRPGVRRPRATRRRRRARAHARVVHCVHRNAAVAPDRDVGGHRRELDDPRARQRAVAARRRLDRGHDDGADGGRRRAARPADRRARDGRRRGGHEPRSSSTRATATTCSARSSATQGTARLTPPYGLGSPSRAARRRPGVAGLRGALRRRLPLRARRVGRRRVAGWGATGAVGLGRASRQPRRRAGRRVAALPAQRVEIAPEPSRPCTAD